MSRLGQAKSGLSRGYGKRGGKETGGGGWPKKHARVPEIIDPVFAKTSPKRSFPMTEYERFWLVFTKTRVYKFGHRY
jgi:hypothetical protein